jgi:hypothetical protein
MKETAYTNQPKTKLNLMKKEMLTFTKLKQKIKSTAEDGNDILPPTGERATINTRNADELVGLGINNDNEFMRTGDVGADEGNVNTELEMDVLASMEEALHANNVESGDAGDGSSVPDELNSKPDEIDHVMIGEGSMADNDVDEYMEEEDVKSTGEDEEYLLSAIEEIR